jgi:hypothetical protein
MYKTTIQQINLKRFSMNKKDKVFNPNDCSLFARKFLIECFFFDSEHLSILGYLLDYIVLIINKCMNVESL